MSTTTSSASKSRPRPPADAPTSFPMDWPFVERILRSPNARTIYLWGPPGVGKTWVAYHCNPAELEVFACTITEDTASQELRGHYLPRGRGEMVWHDGPVTAAMRKGARLVLNEVTHGGPEVHTLLHPILEQIDTARLTLPTNETVRPAPGFQVVCTDNHPPEDLPPALRDRFDSILEVRDPHPEALKQISERLRRAFLRLWNLEPDRSIGLRQLLSLQRFEGELGLKGACLAVFGPQRGALLYEAIVLGEAQN